MGVSTIHLLVALAILSCVETAPPNKPSLIFQKPANHLAGTGVTESADVELKCESAGATTYSMTKDGKDEPAVNAASGVLAITTFASATHTGTYKCKAKNAGQEESPESDPLEVFVTGAPEKPEVTVNPEKFAATGYDVTLTCKSTGSTTYKWYKDANPTPLSGKNEDTLTFSPYATATDEATYTCHGLSDDTQPKWSLKSDPLPVAAVECAKQADCKPLPNKVEFQCGDANTCVDPCDTKSCKAEAGYTKCTAVVGECVCQGGVFKQEGNTCKDPCDTKECAKTTTTKSERCEARAGATCTCVTENFIVDGKGKCVKSGSTNVQMSYLMLGLVTLVSAVWSGRVW